ncbi:MAG: type II toxin-antitoxin system VapC family toxin [Rhizobiales bacterium]|nr:type II toxin-antitoxin system VapC family toxin [Rhizobacter sp.]
MSLVYVDTGVLMKRYVRTPTSDAIDDLLGDEAHRFALSEISLIEMESALARRAREPGGKPSSLPQQRLRFETDLRLGFFDLQPMSPAVLLMARQLIAEGKPPLATLDAIHLATALKAEAGALATDDRQLARAAKAQSLGVISFL